jgi:toxin ParE1/3/4
MRVIVSDQAAADIETITDFIASDSVRRARSFAGELRAACYGLSETPYRFEIIERYRRHGLRRRIHGGYAIVYRVLDTEVVVLRVLSSFMDIEQVLGTMN